MAARCFGYIGLLIYGKIMTKEYSVNNLVPGYYWFTSIVSSNFRFHPTTESGNSTPLRLIATAMEPSYTSPTPPAPATVPNTGRGRTISRENSVKTMVTNQISQAILSTSNLIRIMLQSSPSQDKLIKIPKNLLAKASTIKNTQQVLEQMPLVISSLDAYMDHGLQRYGFSKLAVAYKKIGFNGEGYLKKTLIREKRKKTSWPSDLSINGPDSRWRFCNYLQLLIKWR